MVDLTKGIDEWVTWIPDYNQRLEDGSMFENLKQKPKDQIRCKIKILNHNTRSQYLALIKTIENISQINELTVEARKNIVEDNSKDWENIVSKGQPVVTGKQFYESQTDTFVVLAETTLMADVPLRPDKPAKNGQKAVDGDEKNSGG